MFNGCMSFSVMLYEYTSAVFVYRYTYAGTDHESKVHYLFFIKESRHIFGKIKDRA